MRLISLSLLLFPIIAVSQNLIPNGNFEERNNCPSGLRQIYEVKNWYSASPGTPEYFNTCGFSGTVSPVKGQGMLGLIAYASYDSDLEYVGVELSDRLKAGQKYKLSFYLRAKEDAPFLINKIGAILSEKPLQLAYWKEIDIKPQVFAKEIISANKWTKIEGSFTAKGNEKYITLGSFFPKEQIKNERYRRISSHGWYSYYYFDDIQLQLLEEFQQASESNQIRQNLNITTVYFDTDEFTLSLEEQKKIIDFIRQLESMEHSVIEINGHTDSDASEDYNKQLSILRCNEVARIIALYSKIETVLNWSGELSPAVSNDNETNKALNRRVELRAILK